MVHFDCVITFPIPIAPATFDLMERGSYSRHNSKKLFPVNRKAGRPKY